MINLPDSTIAQYPQLASEHIGWFEAFLAVLVRSIPFVPQSKEDQLLVFLITSDVISWLLLGLTTLVFSILAVILLKRLYLVFKVLRTKRIDLHDQVFLEISPLHTEKTNLLATTEFFRAIHSLLVPKRKLFQFQKFSSYLSVEIVSSKAQGIRYLLSVPKSEYELVEKTLSSHFPNLRITVTNDYLGNKLDELSESNYKYQEFAQTNVFTYPIASHDKVEQSDPATFLATMMGKLKKDEVVAYQLVLSDVDSKVNQFQTKILDQIVNEEDVFASINSVSGRSMLGKVAVWLIRIVLLIVFNWFYITFLVLRHILQRRNKRTLKTSGQKELLEVVKEKLSGPLFEVSIRVVVKTKSDTSRSIITRGIATALSSFNNSYQSISEADHWSLFQLPIFNKLIAFGYKARNHSSALTSVFSASELANLYHFPSIFTAKVEDLSKTYSKQLPAPLSIKNSKKLDVIFGTNSFGNSSVNVGLSDEDRSRHVYILGQTGSGKSTIIYHMAKDDIQKGRGVAVVDPHGDLAEDLLNTIPEDRIKDCIYFNPYDPAYPVGVNLLELPEGLSGDDLEREKEAVCEGVISVFRRVFSNDEKANAHRIEYILRNAIYTAFTIPDATIFTLYELLNNPKFKKKVVRELTDENLKNFWKNEFGKAGNYQIVKMVSGVTAKIGRFLFSPSAKRILEQPKSTISFDDVLDSGKILICNLSEGKLGEDTSQLLGTTLVTKIQLSAMRRERKDNKQRKPYYLFVDEFQNFATSSFTKLLSGGRKFGLRLTIAEQTTAQQDDRNVVNVILANTGTVICFRTASPIDAKLMADQFHPYVYKSDINNLPRYNFYMRLAAVNPEEPFSGMTLPIDVTQDKKHVNQVIKTSRQNFAAKYSESNTVQTNMLTKSKPKFAKSNTLLP